jgi:acyl carrier protein
MNDHWIRFTSCGALAVWFSSTAAGCDRGPRPLSGPMAVVRSPNQGLDTDQAAIIVILGKQFGKEPGEIQSSASLKDLGADELDLVEVVMELEEAFHVKIADGAAERAAGSAPPENMLKALTPPKLAALLAEARLTSSAVGKRQPAPASGDGRAKRSHSAP